MSYQKKLIWLIAISTLVRLIFASSLELSNVEVYYWALSRKLEWNYFDHPPMVAWLIRLTTGNLTSSEILVRLGAVITSAICTWLIFKIGTLINGQRTGWFAALLYTSSIYSSIEVGVFILPDSPQMVFWLSSLLLAVKIIHTPPENSKYRLLWCLFGVLTGLCIMSKVHGVFLWLGMGSYLLLFDRNRLKNPYVYLSLAITLIVISPIIIWNFHNDFITYKFHSDRVNLAGAGLHMKMFLKALLGVIFSTGPIHYFLIGNSIYWIFKGNSGVDKKNIRLLLLFGLPLIVILFIISMFRETLPHWPGPAFSILLILPAIQLASKEKYITGKFPVILKLALSYSVLIVVLQVLLLNYFPGTLSPERQGIKTGTNDLTLDSYGWREAGTKYDSLYKSDVLKKLMPSGAPIIITDWTPAAHIEFYMASRTGQQTFGIGDVIYLHQYYWMNKYKSPLKYGGNAYYICPSNLFTYKTFDKVISGYKNYELALSLPVYRSGVVCKEYYIFRLKGYQGYSSKKKSQ